MSVEVIEGECLAAMAAMEPESVDAVCCDPPYHLTNNTGSRSPNPGQYTPIGEPKKPKGGFMGKQWDGGDIAFRPETWAAVLRVLKPGGHLLAFGAPKNAHRLTCAIEDAGFEIRDTLMWLFGSGFPKSLDVSKAIDKAAGVERPVVGHRTDGPSSWMLPQKIEHRANGGTGMGYADGSGKEYAVTGPATPEAARWQGWGTALKPAYEPIILARKLLIGTVAENVLAHGVGGLNIDASRVATDPTVDDPRLGGKGSWGTGAMAKSAYGEFEGREVESSPLGRWPANIVHDGSLEVLSAFPNAVGQIADASTNPESRRTQNIYGPMARSAHEPSGQKTYENTEGTNFAMKPGARRGDAGSAARFYYCAKANAADRIDSKHPTVKPIALMRWLVRMITPPGGLVLDPFAGTGTTGQAALEEGFDAILIEREAEYCADIRRRLAAAETSAPVGLDAF